MCLQFHPIISIILFIFAPPPPSPNHGRKVGQRERDIVGAKVGRQERHCGEQNQQPNPKNQIGLDANPNKKHPMKILSFKSFCFCFILCIVPPHGSDKPQQRLSLINGIMVAAVGVPIVSVVTSGTSVCDGSCCCCGCHFEIVRMEHFVVPISRIEVKV